MSKWTTELTVGFVPLPKEKEEGYWETIRYFAELMFADLIDPEKEEEAIETIDK